MTREERTELEAVKKTAWVSLFAVSMAFAEAAVVVYLRKIYYPEGFEFPLIPVTDNLIGIEVLRESVTILMLLSVSVLAGRRRWERFAYFLLCFGVWDIFYYVWLKLLLDWPSSILEWDILFLIPLPWTGPVIAPVSVSILMIASGILIIRSYNKGHNFRPALTARTFALTGTAFILYSFMYDTGATLLQQPPKPYPYGLLFAGEALYAASFIASYTEIRKHGKSFQ